jgi:hypothetical protein
MTSTAIRLPTRRSGAFRSQEFHLCGSCFIESV